MVRLSAALFRSRNFIDSVYITVRGGRGGNGLAKYGGVGGKGGDIYLEACDSYSLKILKREFPSQRFAATPGEDSKRFRILGTAGKDTILKCPPGVSVITNVRRNIGEVNKDGERVLLARGGAGGCPGNNFIGQKGELLSLTLDLKLLADVGFVGFPNAGKSSLLRALSNAHPKVANYPFTTLEPHIGTLSYEDFRTVSAADLPGLIEGAHLNYGMGHKFLKHCIRTKVLLFVVDIDGFRLNPKSPYRTAFETVMFLNKELELYDEELLSKPMILAVNKMDNDLEGNKVMEFIDMVKNAEIYAAGLSSEMKPDVLIKFDAVIPISAKNHTNISVLKDKIRTIIDIYNEKKMQQQESHLSYNVKKLGIVQL